MGHEVSETVQFDGNAWWVINGHTGAKLGGPFPTAHEATNYAKIRTNMFNMEPGQGHGEQLKGLGELADEFDQPYQPELPEIPSRPPLPSEFGPLEKTPGGGLQEQRYGIYQANVDEPTPPRRPVMKPPVRPGLGQLARRY